MNPNSDGPAPARRLAPDLTLGAIHVLLAMFAVVTLIPFFWMFSAAFKDREDFFTSLFLPTGGGFLGVAWERLTVENFRRLFAEVGLGNAMLNSFLLASTSALTTTLCASMGGYALAKFRFGARNGVLTYVLAALIIPGPLLLAPGYQVIFNLGLLNSFGALLLPHLATAFGVFLFRQSMVNSVPDSLIESARIDGAGEFRIFFQIVLPVVRPMIGAFLMINFMGTWNNFIGPQVMLQSQELFPLSVAVNQLKGSYGQEYGMIMAGTVISVSPVLMLFLLLQKEFISGLTSGAVKG